MKQRNMLPLQQWLPVVSAICHVTATACIFTSYYIIVHIALSPYAYRPILSTL